MTGEKQLKKLKPKNLMVLILIGLLNNTRWEHNAYKIFMGMLWTFQETWDNQEEFSGQPDDDFKAEDGIPKNPLEKVADLAERLSAPIPDPLGMERMDVITQNEIPKSRIT